MADSDSTLEAAVTTSTPESTEQKTSHSESATPVESQESAAAEAGLEHSATSITPNEDDKQKASEEWARLSGLSQSIPNITTYSMAKRVAIGLLGPTVRIWRVDNKIQIGYEKDGTKSLLGEGPTYTDALRLVAFTLAHAAARVNHAEGKLTMGSGQTQG